MQEAGNEFAQTIDNSLAGFSAWLNDAKETIVDEVEASIQNVKNSVYNLSCPDINDFPVDPLVLDLNGDGIKLTGATDGTAYFDLDADGIREKVGWVSSQDGLLVRDLNGNGKIDNIGELIGSETQDAYAFLDGFDKNNDNKINNKDAIWKTLKVWQNKNSNGVTNKGELKSLAHHKITSFSLNDRYMRKNKDGNFIYSNSSFVKDGETQETQAVFFDIQQRHTKFDYPKNWNPHSDVQELPTL